MIDPGEYSAALGDFLSAITASSGSSGWHASSILRVPAGRVIFRRGDPATCCYVVLKGAVKVTLPLISGQETLLAMVGKGDVVGEMALLDGRPRSATVTAVKPSELHCISSATFNRVALSDAELTRRLLRMMALRVRRCNEAIMLQQMPLRARLAGALLHLIVPFGESLPDGRTLIRHRISQAELGRMIGSARENVNRQLAEWHRDRLLSRISAYYCVENVAALQCLARGEQAR